MLMTLTASAPIVTKTTTIRPLTLIPIAIHRRFLALITNEFSKKDSFKSPKSKPCFARFATRLGSSHTILILFCSYDLIEIQDRVYRQPTLARLPVPDPVRARPGFPQSLAAPFLGFRSLAQSDLPGLYHVRYIIGS